MSAFTRALSTNNYGPFKFIVDGTTVANGTHSTIAAAIASASSGDTIFIRDGTYTENLTLKVGVNLVAATGSELTPTVTIIGKCTLTTAGTVTLSGIRLQTNADFAIAVTGTVASILNLEDCYLNCTNNTGISFTTSSASAQISLINCMANVGTTLIALWAHSSAGVLYFDRCHLTNTGLSTTNSTSSAGATYFGFTYSEVPFTTSSTAVLSAFNCHFSTFESNQKFLTQGGDSNAVCRQCTFKSGTATAITVTSGLNLQMCNIESTNTTIIDGAGTLTYTPLFVANSGGTWTVSTTTQTVREIGPSVTVGSSTSGGTNTLLVQNASNTASSNALMNLSVGGTSAADAFTKYTVSGTTNWSQGVDNSDSDAYVLAASTALGTTNVMRASTAGEINYPLQPAFLGFLGSPDSNVTGDGTYYLLGQGNALTEIFDQSSDFTTAGVFTAPITGRYHLSGCLYISGLTSSHTSGWIELTTSNRAPTSNYLSPAACKTVGNEMVLGISMLVDMDATDTASLRCKVESGTKVVDVISGASSIFTGYLEC